MSLKSRWHDARIEVFKTRIQHLIDAEKWPQALTTVIDFAQWADGRITDAETWLDMTTAATQIVGHLEDPAEYRAFLTHFASPFLGEGSRPNAELLDAFASISEHAAPSVMISIGRWLTDARPGWPLGPYLVGHFSELEDHDRPDGAASTVLHFQLASERAQRAGLDDWYLHTRLRHGAILLTTGADRRRGRKILGEIDWTRLHPTDQLWMAVALARSGRWTDRLRAMDIVLDLSDAVTRARPRYRSLRQRDLRRAAAAIFKLAGLHLPEAESRRLEELSQTLFSGDEQKQWKNFLQSRRQLSKVASLPFEQSSQVLRLLDKLSAVYPERWTPTARRFQILDAGRNGTYRSGDDLLAARRRDRRLPVADAVAALNSFLHNADNADADNAELEAHLKTISDALAALVPDGDGADVDGAAARPIALIWPALLERNDIFDLASSSDCLAQIAAHYTSVAPAPGYGWWALAAHLYRAGLDDVARPVARQALVCGDEVDDVDDKLRRYVASQTFEQAVDDHNAAEARRWVDAL